MNIGLYNIPKISSCYSETDETQQDFWEFLVKQSSHFTSAILLYFGFVSLSHSSTKILFINDHEFYRFFCHFKHDLGSEFFISYSFVSLTIFMTHILKYVSIKTEDVQVYSIINYTFNNSFLSINLLY